MFKSLNFYRFLSGPKVKPCKPIKSDLLNHNKLVYYKIYV